MASIEDVRAIARPLPRSYEVVVRDRVKFRVGKIVYLAFSRDETVLGFAFPREERGALLAARPEVFLPPDRSDERFNWLQLRLAAVELPELEELVLDAWRMVVPKKVATAYLAGR
ncbi:MmcQ/YjbR family DNA-binding protein [Cryptosporangium aurantiacum]|uniref:YjbR protein n=1 Tax=Cryptosporangium aurantiacum TaxID=134849 RepID=A0A1M7RP54_9ACTN|nr:MmcQ/YjbR family DNA-binding protein [Cryptosporangium aurantiacum]SHN48115.1 hypothetical protein SAMN05443668_13412 [Cryptosporangium aurantiacum]